MMGDAAGTHVLELGARIDRGEVDQPTLSAVLEALRASRDTPLEREALGVALRALTRFEHEGLRAFAGRVLIERGEASEAERILAAAKSAPAIVIAADLAHERGALPLALDRLRRAWLIDVDCPGLAERLARWDREPRPETALVDFSTAVDAATNPAASHLSIVGELGRGGASTVYTVRDAILEREVAVKVYGNSALRSEACLNEARVATKLAGPGIVRVFDVDPKAGSVTMELCRGGSLGARLGIGTAHELGASWVRDVARALARVHAAGWVHLDVKPENVLFRASGEAVLGDFSIARPIGAPCPPGSPGYSAPARLAGASARPSFDLFALGRTVERVLDSLAASDASSALRRMAELCLDAEREQIPDARAFVERLEVELGGT